MLSNKNRFFIKLIQASRLLTDQQTLDQGLQELVEISARVLETDYCAVMLLEESQDSDQTGLCLHAQFGTRPPALECAVDGDDRSSRLLSVSIIADEKKVGVIDIARPCDGGEFDQEDRDLLTVFALFVGQSIANFHLHKTLQSRFVQLALMWDARKKGAEPMADSNPDPVRLGKIVAKTIFRELTSAGFPPQQIIGVTTEIIELLQQAIEAEQKELGNHRGP